MDNAEFIRVKLYEAGFTEAGEINISDLVFDRTIRKICEDNKCHGYGRSWACPPAVGTLDECRERCERFDRMFLINKKFDLKDRFDFKGMGQAMRDFKKYEDIFDDLMEGTGINYLLLGNEGCGRCEECTWPDAPCRFPKRLHHSLEGYGFDIGRMAKLSGIHYNSGPNTVTFLGAVLFDETTETYTQ